MELEKAKAIAEEVKAKLVPFCQRLEIAGSIRRGRPFPKDIDIVCIPSNQGQFIYALQQMGKIKIGGQKLIRCELPQIVLDIYAATPETWATLLLIRTGSAKHNIMMCSRAKRMGMHLHADGTGLTRNGNRVAGETEESIFATLQLPYKQPKERE